MTRLGKRNLKEQVLALRQDGKTVVEIKNILQCSFSTISYHLYKKTRQSTKSRINATKKNAYASNYYKTNPVGILSQKYSQFFRMGRNRKVPDIHRFTKQELIDSIPPNPHCYLTGMPINLANSSNFSLDHKIPTSKGGTNDLSNLGLSLASANRAKNDMLECEFVDLCKQVLQHHGYTISLEPSTPETL